MRHAYNLWHASLLATPLCSFFIFDRFVFFLFISEGKTTYKLRDVTVPKYFWKAVCADNQSIVFVAENNVGVSSYTTVQIGTCFDKKMTTIKGIIQCDSLSKMRGQFKDFKFPNFGKICSIDKKGDFLKSYLNFQ